MLKGSLCQQQTTHKIQSFKVCMSFLKTSLWVMTDSQVQAQIVNRTISHYSMVLRKSQTSRGLIILEDTLKDRVMVLRIL